jgi:hypothetical protein
MDALVAALDHVEPGTASGSEVKVEAWAAQQPAMGFEDFIGGAFDGAQLAIHSSWSIPVIFEIL